MYCDLALLFLVIQLYWMRSLLFIITLVFTSPMLVAQTSSNDTIHWNENRPLTFDDFRGENMEFTGFVGENFCLLSANYSRPNIFSKTEYMVEAIWDRKKSWISDKAKTDQALQFFQVCFDIYELHARLLKKKCSELPKDTDPTEAFQPMYNQAMTALMEEYNMFRRETKMGQDSETIEVWSEAIRLKLDELAAYK